MADKISPNSFYPSFSGDLFPGEEIHKDGFGGNWNQWRDSPPFAKGGRGICRAPGFIHSPIFMFGATPMNIENWIFPLPLAGGWG
jgi:hypothetical protein